MAYKYGMCKEAWVVHQESCVCGCIRTHETDLLEGVLVHWETSAGYSGWVVLSA